MTAEPPPELIEELYGVPLDEFTALRDKRAKELRKQDRAAADAVKKLRKPSVPAWAVNQVSRRARSNVDALLAAGEALRQAQLGGGDRDAIRSASTDEREAVERLVGEAERALADAGRGATGAALEGVRETLHAAASDDEARDLIGRGVLTEARQTVGLGGAGSEAAFAGMAEQRPARKPVKNEPDTEAQREAEAERKRAAKARVKEAKAARGEAEGAARKAVAAADGAERERDQAREALADAERRLEDARGEAEAAREEADRAGEELAAAEEAS